MTAPPKPRVTQATIQRQLSTIQRLRREMAKRGGTCSSPSGKMVGSAGSWGTLFPGLDLPFKNIVNQMPAETTELRELMALDFVTAELGLYLDTHSDDAQAFATFQSFLKMYDEGKKEYVARFGPICRSDLISAKSYTWLNDPWPWDYVGAKEG